MFEFVNGFLHISVGSSKVEVPLTEVVAFQGGLDECCEQHAAKLRAQADALVPMPMTSKRKAA